MELALRSGGRYQIELLPLLRLGAGDADIAMAIGAAFPGKAR